MSKILRKKNVKGFSILELILVFAVIAALAAIAMPQLLDHVNTSRNASAKATGKKAFIAAQMYFNDEPGGSLSSVQTLVDHGGFRQTRKVTVTVNGNVDTLVVTAHHETADKTYTLSFDGDISW